MRNIQQTKLDEFYESFDFITTIEYNGKLFASSKSRSFFVIFVMIIKIFRIVTFELLLWL